MLQGDFRLPKPNKKQLIIFGVLGGVGTAVLAGVVVLFVFVISAWFGRPVIFGHAEGPDQPIDFPHTVHVQDLGLDCAFCHRNVDKAAAASIPAVSLCMTCHKVVGDDIVEVEKLRSIYEDGKAIDWVRVHRVPDHVHFVHEAHVRFFTGSKKVLSEIENPGQDIRLEDAKKIKPDSVVGQTIDVAVSDVCSICHGDVGAMVKVEQVRSLKMGDCVDCHRKHDAPTDCVTCHY